jgi:hypothetical protein
VYKDKAVLATNQACHAGLDHPGLAIGSESVVNALMRPKRDVLTEEEGVMYLDWLLNRSPYSSTFISKDALDCIYHKATISDSNTPSNLMAAGMVASRRLWEYSSVVRVFCDLVNVGVPEDLAFWLGHITRCEFNRAGRVALTGEHSGHCSLDPRRMPKEALSNFLNHKVTAPNKTYTASKNYEGYDEMYGKLVGYGQMSCATWAHDNFPYVKSEKVATNPFAKAVIGGVDAFDCTYPHFISTMKDFYPQILACIHGEV